METDGAAEVEDVMDNMSMLSSVDMDNSAKSTDDSGSIKSGISRRNVRSNPL